MTLCGQMISELPCKRCGRLETFANTGGGVCEFCRENIGLLAENARLKAELAAHAVERKALSQHWEGA